MTSGGRAPVGPERRPEERRAALAGRALAEFRRWMEESGVESVEPAAA